MAYSYNLVNPFEPQETEEERRQRLAREAAMRGEVMAPVAPVVPDLTYQRMLQVESGNRDYTAQGQPMVSPAGAKYAAQVMPATAQQPGFGIRPAAADTPEEYNRVGREYFAAMQNRYGDDTLAAAAYNAGPGRVDAALKQAQQTGRPVQEFLPQETQQYIQKVSMQNVQPVAPQAQTQEPRPALGTGITVPGMTAVPVGQDSTQAINRYQEFQNDPANLLKLKNDDTMPEFIRTRSGERAFDIMNQERQVQAAERRLAELSSGVAQGDRKATNALSRELASQEGNWVKYLLLRYVDPLMAREEAAKLGYGNRWQTTSATIDGQTQRGMVEFNAKGLPVKGIKQDGTAMTEDELVQFGTQVMDSRSVGIAGRTRVRDEAGNEWTEVPTTTGMLFYDNARKQGVPIGRTTPISVSGDVATQYNVSAAKAQGTAAGEGLTPGPVPGMVNVPGTGTQSQAASVAQAIPSRTAPVQTQPMGPVAPQAVAPMAPQGVQTQTMAPAPTGTIAEQRAALQATTAELTYFREKTLPAINKRAEDGSFVKDTRKTQMVMLTDPRGGGSAIMGIYGGSGSEYNKARALITDIIAGTYGGQDGDQKFAETIKNISLPDEQLAALRSFQQMNRGIDAKTLAENAGEGPKSNADMQMNRDANMGDIGYQPAYSVLNGLSRSMFSGDMNIAKLDFFAKNQNTIKTETQLNQAWSRQKDQYTKQYEGIYKERLHYIDGEMTKRFGNNWRKLPQDRTQEFYRNASIHSFVVYPTPEYDRDTGKLQFPTQQSKLAAMRAVTGR